MQDDELTAFIRIGSDYKGNFYEYEIPLKLTPPGHYDNDSDEDRAIVWPEENSFNIDLSVLQEAKQERNRQMQEPGSSLSVSDVFVYQMDNAQDFCFRKSEPEQCKSHNGRGEKSDKDKESWLLMMEIRNMVKYG